MSSTHLFLSGCLLRNPVDRAYSHYQHMRRVGYEALSFEEAIDQEEERLRPEVRRMQIDRAYRSKVHQALSYVSRGIYVDQLKRWRTHFPAEQMLVLRSEDFLVDPGETYRLVLAFLGLPALDLGTYRVYNQTACAEMKPETRSRLVGYFGPHNQRLYAYLGRDLDWDW